MIWISQMRCLTVVFFLPSSGSSYSRLRKRKHFQERKR